MHEHQEAVEINKKFLEGINKINKDIEFLKRDIIRNFKNIPKGENIKPSLFGSVKAEDITEEMIEKSKQSVFKLPDDIV